MDERGEPIRDSTLVLMFNADPSAVTFSLPHRRTGQFWVRILDTVEPTGGRPMVLPGDRFELKGRSVAIVELADSDEAAEAPPGGVV